MKMTLRLITVFSICTSFLSLSSQFSIEWESSFGGSMLEFSYSMDQTSDEGCIVAGIAQSSDGDITSSQGTIDCWIVKLDNTGALEWQKSLGGSGDDRAYSILQNEAGNYVFTGSTQSNDGDVQGNHGNSDLWVVELTAEGDLVWQHTYGGSISEKGHSLIQSLDGGYVIAGYARSIDGDLDFNQGSSDYWVLKISPLGEIEWQKTYGGSGIDIAYSIINTLDQGFLVAGESNSNDGDVSELHGNWDFWIIKLDFLGELEWERTYGGSFNEFAYDVIQTTNGDYVVAGLTQSIDGDVSGNQGYFDYWIVKISSDGELIWENALGGSEEDWARAVCQTADGGFAITGMSLSNDGDITDPHGDHDLWLVQLSSSGELVSEKSYGGSGQESGFAIQPTSDNGLILSGQSTSTDGDVSVNNGFRDYWILKLAPEPLSISEVAPVLVFKLSPNPVSDIIHLQINKQSKNSSFEILDQQGRVCLVGEILELKTQISVHGLSNGLYNIRVVSDEGETAMLFVKN